ncbi:MAG: hypothetical protein IKJ97_02750 [Bacteroidaceae bacterium]|nr:hypothetical protein [Bacteroidaceae bacterium]
MRKFTLLIASLFITIGAMAQTLADGVYTIQADENGKRGYLAASSSYSRPVLVDIAWSNYQTNSCTTNIVENSKYWYVKSVDGVTYLSNIGNGGFIYDNGTDDIYFGAPFGLNFTNHNGYIHVGSGTGVRYLSMGCGTTAPNQVKWEKGNGNDGGCLLTFTAVENGTTQYASQIAVADAMIKTSQKYVSFGVYTINNTINTRGTMAYGTYNSTEYFGLADVTLSGYTDRDIAVSDVANKYWCIAETENGIYIYNIGKGLFLQNYVETNATCSRSVANGFSFETKTESGTEYTCIKSGDMYLSFSCGWYPNQGQVRWLAYENNAAALTLTSVNGGFANYMENLMALDAIIDAYENPYALTVTAAGYATLYLGFNAAIPEGAEAYIVKQSDINEGYITMTQIDGTIPANTGVIVKANQGTYEFVYSADETTALTGNLLAGSVADEYVEGAAYVLGNENGVGLYKALLNKNEAGEAGTTHFKNNANKAYLPASAVPNKSVAFYGFDWDGTTGIDEITENREQSTAIYDLTGRCVESISAPGIYIINGKKVLVK